MCYSGSSFLYLTDHDASNPGSGVVCVPYEDVVTVGRLSYYLVRILASLGI